MSTVIEIDTAEKLSGVIQDHQERLKTAEELSQENKGALAGSLEETAKQLKEKDEKIATLESGITELRGNIKSLTTLVKTSWDKEPGHTGGAYRIGKFAAAVQKGDLKTIAKMGGLMVKDANRDWVVPKEWSGIREKADLGTPLMGDSGTGQYLLPQTLYAEEVLRIAMEQSQLIPLITNVPMNGRLIRWPVEATAFTFTAVTSEATDKTEVNPTFTYADLEAETYAGWVGVTDELLEDTFVAIGELIRTQAVEDLIAVIEKQSLNSNASPATGVLHAASVNEHVMSGSGFADINFDELKSLRQKLTTKKKRRGAYFIMHPTIMDELINDADAQGRYFFNPDTGGPRSLWGYPYILSDEMPDIDDDAVSTAFVIFGNPGRILHGTRMGLEFKYFDQTMYAVQDDENFFRVRTRQAFVTTIPDALARLVTAAS